MSNGKLKQSQLQNLLKTFKERYAEQYHLLALGYFGSYARNEARADSDVDIVFDTDRPNLFKTAMMKQDLEAWIGRPVDVLQLKGLANSRLRERVEKETVYI